MAKNTPEKHMLAERANRESEHPRSIQFPAMLSTIKSSFMSLAHRTGTIEAHGRLYKTDLDYFFHLGISAEGFGLKFGMDELLKAGKWNNEPLRDCFLSEGIKYRLVADESVKIKDGILNPDTIREEVVAHLSTDLPVIVLKKAARYMPFELVMGYTDYGNCLITHHGAGKAKNLTKLAKPRYNWVGKICAVIFIDGITDAIDKKDVILRSLSRAYEMLGAAGEVDSEYGYGSHMWKTWISRLQNDNNYMAKSNALKYIVPEKFDLAERRAFAARFFEEAETYVGANSLKDAFDAFNDIHDRMWDIHWMVKGENEGKLLERETRNRIIEVLRYCQSLELKAAENIGQVLDKQCPSKPDKFDNHVNVLGADGQPHNPTYLRRAKGLVKSGRAQWTDEKTIKLIGAADIAGKPESTAEKHQYHCQHQAESFARAVLPVPGIYPLQAGLPEDFPAHFSRLCGLARDIYMDMAKRPEAYGLMLVDIASKDHNLAREGYRSLHRFGDTLSNLSRCGKLEKHQLVVNADAFRKAVKSGSGLVSGPVPKYELVLSRLVDFGFVISGFEGKPFGKGVESFTVEYSDYPEMVDTIKFYCGCWDALKTDMSTVKIWPKEFHHHYYRFDYKITADREKIPMLQWVSDEADYLGCSPGQKMFAVKLYEHSLQYKDVEFDGDYNYKSKRISRFIRSGYIAMEETSFLLHVRLKGMDKYMAEISSMPESIKKRMAQDSCRHCNFQGATAERCKFRVHWTFDGQPHEGCAHACFYFDDLDAALVPDYWRLLELEYGLKKV